MSEMTGEMFDDNHLPFCHSCHSISFLSYQVSLTNPNHLFAYQCDIIDYTLNICLKNKISGLSREDRSVRRVWPINVTYSILWGPISPKMSGVDRSGYLVSKVKRQSGSTFCIPQRDRMAGFQIQSI
jgi:hypothetical protein